MVVERRGPLARDPIGEAGAHWRRRGWESAADGMELVTSVQRVQQLLLGRIERALRPSGLTFARYEVLMLLELSRSGALPIGKVGERLQVHPASVTNAVDRLEAEGLVVRERHPDDGRSVVVRITDDGRELALRMTAILNEQVFAALPLGRTDVDDVRRGLRELRRGFGDFE